MIKYFTISFLLIFMSFPNHAQNSPLKEYQWKNRILIIHEGKQNTELTKQQLENFNKATEDYKERALIVILITQQDIAKIEDSKSSPLKIERSELLAFLSINDTAAYKVFLIGKDGGIKLQSEEILSNKKLFSTIDAMPMRRNEMRDN